ncbi:MAG: DUF3810 family protein [Clostridia bacterium]|nr:DUF3810 family protein [Clostridia bacterium]MBR4086895.1 DUF3810 family protein [Clostridia bacterium]
MSEFEKMEGLQEAVELDELEALVGEFTLSDLAEFDEELEFDAADLDLIKPAYTTKEKMKFLLMNNTVFSIIKWCFAGLGLIGLVLYILAMVDTGISEALSQTLAAGIGNAFAAVSNLVSVSLLEILAAVVIVGILGYAGFLVYKTIKEKEGIKIAGFWVQFVYVLLAIFGTGFLLYTMAYGVTTNRVRVYQNEGFEYKPNFFYEQSLHSGTIYYVDQVNDAAVDGIKNQTLFYTETGHSRYASTGSSLADISKAVNACYMLAAEDYPFLKGEVVDAKPLLLSPMYTAMGIGSMYSPLTGEVLVNTDYPELAIPMQIARAIAKQRGITNDGDAKFIAFLVCSKYADQLSQMNTPYNFDYIKYSAYMDAYMEVGSVSYEVNKNIHLYCAAALKETAKKDFIAYVDQIDALYGNINTLEFIAADSKTSTAAYQDLPKLLYVDLNTRINNNKINLKFVEDPNTEQADVVPLYSSKYQYARYLLSYFHNAEAEFADDATALYEEYNPEAEPNDDPDRALV